MLKKIHSNRDPASTLSGEIKKEFGHYFAGAARALARCLGLYPRLFFAGMILALAGSFILSFTVFRLQDKQVVATKNAIGPASEGFERISLASEQILESIRLKRLIDSLSGKNGLSQQDSIALNSALDRLRQINKPSNK